MMYVENPNSGVAKAKVIDDEVELNTFLSEKYIRSAVLKKIYFSYTAILNFSQA